MVFGIVVHIATRIGLAFSPNFTVFALFKFLTAAFAIGWYTTTYIYGKGTCMLKHKIIYDWAIYACQIIEHYDITLLSMYKFQNW